MRRHLLALAALLAWVPVAAHAAEALDRARSEAAAHPQDYGALTTWAREAAAEGALDEALQAWTLAGTLSGDNPESLAARVDLLVQLRRYREAQTVAGLAVDRSPDEAWSWMLRGWSWRFQPALPGLGARVAAGAYAHATELDPQDADAWCGLGRVRLALGDAQRARADLAQADALGGAACTADVRAAAAPSWQLWGGVRGIAFAYQDHDARTAGGAGVATVGATLSDLVTLGASGRGLSIRSVDTTGTASSVDQAEVWGRLSVAHAGHGVEVLGGGVWGLGSPSYTTSLFGARAWTTWWLTLRMEGAYGAYGTGNAGQIGGAVRLPLWRGLWVEGGVDATRFDTTLGTSGPWDGAWQLAGRGSLSATVGPVTLSAGGAGGSELHPLRFDANVSWIAADRLTASGFARVAWRISPRVSLDLGYEGVRLEDASTRQPYVLHLIDLGLVLATRRPYATSER